jgi:hypothetical protein
MKSRLVIALALVLAPVRGVFGQAAPPSLKLALQRSPADSPVIGSGETGAPLLVMDPMVLKDGEGYHLFYSTFFCKDVGGQLNYSYDPHNPARCDLSQPVSAIGYAFSADRGLTWRLRPTPVLAPGVNDWERYKVETAYVVRVKDELLLFYSALGFVDGKLLNNRFQIGAAFLKLGSRTIEDALLKTPETFVRRRKEPVLPLELVKTSFFNNVQEPSVIYRQGRYELFFIGIGLTLPDKPPCAGPATVCHGQSFTELGLGRAILDRDLNVVERTETPLAGTNWTLNMPEVTYRKGQYLMFSAGFGKEAFGGVHRGEFIQLSTSADGLHWSRPEPVLSPRGGLQFDGWAATTPTAVWDRNQVILFYSAFGPRSFGRQCDMTARWGISVAHKEHPDQDTCIDVTLGRAVAAVPK